MSRPPCGPPGRLVGSAIAGSTGRFFRTDPSAEEELLDRPVLEVVCWGARGSIPAPGPDTTHFGGNTSCVQIRAAGRLLILDAGTGLRELGRRLSDVDGPVDADIFLTHFHMDHIQGFPFFEPLYREGTRLRIHGPARSREGLEAALLGPMGTIYLPVPRAAVAAELTFIPLRARASLPAFRDVPGSDACAAGSGPVEIATYPVRHARGAVGFRIRANGSSVAYVPDNELVGGTYDEKEGWYEGLVDFLSGVDVLFHDAAYSDAEYAAREGWGHSTFHQAVRLAEEAGARRLFLFHHAPERTDGELLEVLEGLRSRLAATGSDLRLDVAREGVLIRLPA